MLEGMQRPHLTNIRLTGYKSIKELDLEMRPINILMGANGAGKSNFLSVFPFLCSMVQGKFQDYIMNNGGANSFLHFGIKNTSEIEVDAYFSNGRYYCTLKHDSFDDKLNFKKEACKVGSYKHFLKSQNGESGLVFVKKDNSYLEKLRADCEKVILAEKYISMTKDMAIDFTKLVTQAYLNLCQTHHFHDTSRTAGFKQTALLEYNDFLYDDARNIASFLYRIKHEENESYQNIVEAVRTVAPFFHDFYLEPRGQDGNKTILLKWLHRKTDEPFSAQQLSDGTARFICLATLLLQPKDWGIQTIILDEPELGLHPVALEVLADIIKSTSRHTQVICSTQSVTFANHFAPEDFIIADSEQGVSSFKRPDAKELEIWLDEYQMGDIWRKNLIGGRPAW